MSEPWCALLDLLVLLLLAPANVAELLKLRSLEGRVAGRRSGDAPTGAVE